MHASTSTEVAANKVMLAFSHTLCALHAKADWEELMQLFHAGARDV